MLVKSKKAIIFQLPLAGVSEKSVVVKFAAVTSNDLLATAKVGYSVADATAGLKTQQGMRPNVYGQGVIELDSAELKTAAGEVQIMKDLLVEKVVAIFSPLNPGLKSEDFEEVVV